jgi:hypothetical protein
LATAFLAPLRPAQRRLIVRAVRFEVPAVAATNGRFFVNRRLAFVVGADRARGRIVGLGPIE